MDSPVKDALLGLSDEKLEEIVLQAGGKKFVVSQIKKWIYEKGVDDPSEMSNVNKVLKEKISELGIAPAEKEMEAKSKDGTHKILFKLWDGAFVEGVMIPSKNRTTYCISSQIGCAMGCTFCATGKMGIKRNLEISEILAQVFLLRKFTGKSPTNIVFMGMGEPFMNYNNALRSAERINDPNGFNVGARKITISTVGVVPSIRKFADIPQQFGLAISLHAPNNELRSKIVPVNSKWNVEEIIDAAKYFNKVTNRIVTIEYVLLSGENDLEIHAKELSRLLNFPSKVNLIPFNDHKDSDHKAPALQRSYDFQEYLEKYGVKSMIRTSRGDDIAAACGQLANDTLKI